MPTPLDSTTSGASTSMPTVAQGSQGAAVGQLQQDLGLSPDGIDGRETTSALKAYQASHGLTPDGIAGPKTWQSFQAEPLLREGSHGPAVARVQQRLGLPPDGIDGPATTRALTDFQNAHGLGADGVVGPRTWQALNATAAPTAPRVAQRSTPHASPSPVATPTASHAAGPAPEPSATASREPALQPGTKEREAVKDVQSRLGMDTIDGKYGPTTASYVRAFQADHRLAATGNMDAQTWKKLDEVGNASHSSHAADASGHYSRLGVLQAMGNNYDSPSSDRADLSDPSMTPQKTVDMLGYLIHNGYGDRPQFTISAVRSDHHDDGQELHAGGKAIDMYPNGDDGLSTLLQGINSDPYVTNVGLGGDYDTKASKALITDTKSHYVFDDNGQTHVHVGDGNFPAK